MRFFPKIALLLVALTQFVWSDPTASIFVKDASEFQAIQKDLESLKQGLGQGNPELDALWEEANKIAKMNDQCSMISINDVLDDACSHFYAVELPEFETKYMELTGELRLGAMKMGNSLAERTEQIKTCATALGGILVSKEQLLKLNGSVDLEPLSFDGAFDATYNFNLYFDADRMKSQQNIMERWLEKCGDIVMRKGGGEFAPLFIESVLKINDSLSNSSANVRIVLEPDLLDFYLDLKRPVSGAYYLSGAKLFSVEALPMGRKFSHLFVNMPRRKVELPLGTDGSMQNFRGRVEFTAAYQEKDLMGRWSWGSLDSNATAAVAKGEIVSTATVGDSTLPAPVVKPLPDSTTAVAKPAKDSSDKNLEKQAAEEKVRIEEQKQAQAAEAAKDAKNEQKKSSFKVHWVPLAISGAVAVGGGVMAAVFNNKAKTEREKSISSHEEYNDQLDKIESAQTMRTVGIGIAAAGLVAVGVTFLF